MTNGLFKEFIDAEEQLARQWAAEACDDPLIFASAKKWNSYNLNSKIRATEHFIDLCKVVMRAQGVGVIFSEDVVVRGRTVAGAYSRFKEKMGNDKGILSVNVSPRFMNHWATTFKNVAHEIAHNRLYDIADEPQTYLDNRFFQAIADVFKNECEKADSNTWREDRLSPIEKHAYVVESAIIGEMERILKSKNIIQYKTHSDALDLEYRKALQEKVLPFGMPQLDIKTRVNPYAQYLCAKYLWETRNTENHSMLCANALLHCTQALACGEYLWGDHHTPVIEMIYALANDSFFDMNENRHVPANVRENAVQALRACVDPRKLYGRSEMARQHLQKLEQNG